MLIKLASPPQGAISSLFSRLVVAATLVGVVASSAPADDAHRVAVFDAAVKTLAPPPPSNLSRKVHLEFGQIPRMCLGTAGSVSVARDIGLFLVDRESRKMKALRPNALLFMVASSVASVTALTSDAATQIIAAPDKGDELEDSAYADEQHELGVEIDIRDPNATINTDI
ncbi:hypothetical protein PF003_g27656 [Phytophthora fragariae]|nr:hypothetical protein PF003_g27656 [Phytophthora fragariae]